MICCGVSTGAPVVKAAAGDTPAVPKYSSSGSGPFGNERPGDLCYFKPWGNLAMFYADYRWDGLIRLGRFDGSFESLRGRGKFPLRIERIR